MTQLPITENSKIGTLWILRVFSWEAPGWGRVGLFPFEGGRGDWCGFSDCGVFFHRRHLTFVI